MNASPEASISFTAEHVLVPYATVVERRERLSRVSAAFRERDRNDADVDTVTPAGVSESGADEGVPEPPATP